jgi:phosphate transport system substrate-binding protein
LSRPLFIYVTKEAAGKEQVQEFVNFYLDIAPKITAEIGYVPMPDSMYQKEKDKFSDFISDIKADSASQE